MAKQTFTTGQVLTAAQMTSLQETAMGGGPATAKTANYVLVAADAGTTVAMNAAGSTTITVNSGLFAAGDTVFIQNLGAGACTVTAGTATVATAGSLILPQNDAGILYFTSASAAIFYDYIQVGATSPLTTKGDLYTFGTSDTRLAVGANGTTLVADSAEATGLKWATPASGGGMTLINTGGTTLTGATTTISSIPATYKDLYIIIQSALPATDAASLRMRYNGDSNTRYTNTTLTEVDNRTYNNSYIEVGRNADNSVTQGINAIYIIDYANTATRKIGTAFNFSINETTTANFNFNYVWTFYNQTSAIDSLSFFYSSGNATSGTIYVYGVK